MVSGRPNDGEGDPGRSGGHGQRGLDRRAGREACRLVGAWTDVRIRIRPGAAGGGGVLDE